MRPQDEPSLVANWNQVSMRRSPKPRPPSGSCRWCGKGGSQCRRACELDSCLLFWELLHLAFDATTASVTDVGYPINVIVAEAHSRITNQQHQAIAELDNDTRWSQWCAILTRCSVEIDVRNDPNGRKARKSHTFTNLVLHLQPACYGS